MSLLSFGGLSLDDSDGKTGKQACDECGKSGDLHCAVCDVAQYCSQKCQIKAWTKHKAACNGGQASPNPPPPTTKNMGAVLGFRFDPESGESNLLWIRYMRHCPGYVSVYLGRALCAINEEFVSGDYEAPMWFDVTYSAIPGQEALPCTLRVHGRDDLSRKNYIGDNSDYDSEYEDEDDEKDPDINMAIQDLKHTGDMAHVWKGPVIVYGIKGFTEDSHPKELVNLSGKMSGEHLLDLMNFFNAIHDPVKMISCVRINCDGDVDNHGRPKFESIMLPTNHAIFDQAPTQISNRIEFPVVAARIPGNIGSCGNTSNSKVTYLYRGCDPSLIYGFNADYGWGSAPLTWDIPVGSCIVARKDMKPLLVEHAEALTDYCERHLGDFFQEQLESEYNEEDEEEDAVRLNREWVLKEISKAKFEEFFQTWKERQGSAVASDLASPYA